MAYIFSQITICIGLGILGVSYFIKKYSTITILCIISSMFTTVGYGLLGAYTAIGLNILGIIAYIFFYIFKKQNKENPLYFIIILWVVTIINGILTFDGPASLIPTISSLIFYFSVWQKNNLVYRIIGIITTISYTIYNALYNSIGGVISQSILFVIALVGFITYLIEIKNNNQKNLNNTTEINTKSH